jgi:nucleotide-binding universal stress UspA family protein
MEGVAKLGLKVKKVQRTDENSAQAIIQYINQHRPSLVVLATHQRTGLARWLHQAQAEPIARATHALTLFVPRRVLGFVARDGSVHLRNIVIPVDQSPRPQRALDAAVALAASLECPQVHFHLLYVGAEEGMPQTTIALRPGWTMEQSTWAGDVVNHILDVSETRDADLIVMATRGHHGFLDAWRGSTTERVLRGTRCPLLAVPVV